MPELPEVETMVRDLSRHLPGRAIVSVALSHDDVLDGVSATALRRGLRGATIRTVRRRAKHALIETDRRILAVQPGMSGALLLHGRALTAGERRYAVLRCRLDDGVELVYRDVRRIGTIRWLTAAGWRRYAERLGPEPLDAALSAAEFAERLRRSRSAVKKVLMDQRFVVGVGNIYANEALWTAGIHPARPANAVSRERLGRLLDAVREILAVAIASDGTSFRDYVTASGEPGAFQELVQVYGRTGEPCPRCGRPIRMTHAIDQRSSFYCPRCQR
jgi:formamidopyrimidine-DNA glycosylase